MERCYIDLYRTFEIIVGVRIEVELSCGFARYKIMASKKTEKINNTIMHDFLATGGLKTFLLYSRYSLRVFFEAQMGPVGYCSALAYKRRSAFAAPLQ